MLRDSGESRLSSVSMATEDLWSRGTWNSEGAAEGTPSKRGALGPRTLLAQRSRCPSIYRLERETGHSSSLEVDLSSIERSIAARRYEVSASQYGARRAATAWAARATAYSVPVACPTHIVEVSGCRGSLRRADRAGETYCGECGRKHYSDARAASASPGR